MPLADNVRRQVDLLLRSIPFVAKETCFALKGGTAINLFVRDLPRLSVDIDLTYVQVSVHCNCWQSTPQLAWRYPNFRHSHYRTSSS